MTCWRGYRKNPQRNEVGMAEEKTFLIKIITPERVFYEGTAIMAEFNTSEGEIGVYAGHIPLTVILKPGVLTLTEESGKKKAALHTGFAEILPDQISILAEAADIWCSFRHILTWRVFLSASGGKMVLMWSNVVEKIHFYQKAV
jgi:hypothetical protein